jgi:DNA-binding response OmpR family regulator
MEVVMAKILAADDDMAMVDYYKALFSEAGFEVETAADGAAALDKYLEVHPDLLILDVDMPNGGGERLFNIIRRILQLGKPVIFVTGLPEKVQNLALTYRWVSIFRKPVKGEELLGEVKRLLAASGLNVGGGGKEPPLGRNGLKKI